MHHLKVRLLPTNIFKLQLFKFYNFESTFSYRAFQAENLETAEKVETADFKTLSASS